MPLQTSNTPAPAHRARSLEAQADRLTRLVARVATDDDGLVRVYLAPTADRAVEDRDLPDDVWRHRGTTPAGFLNYEDTGIVTGSMLAAQSLRYRVTGDPEALDLARRAFAGIEWIYELGARAKHPGYFPKPYDKRSSDQVSRDQYLYVLGGLRRYHAVADAPTRQRIAEMAHAMARYWIDINYTHGYLGLPASSHLDDFMGALMLGVIGQAWRLSGDDDIGAEYRRLRDEVGLAGRMGETLRDQYRRGQTYDGGMVFRQHENPVLMKTLACDALLEIDPDHAAVWQDALRRFAEDELLVCADPESGLNYWVVRYRADDDTVHLTESGPIDELDNPLGLPVLTWGGRRQTAGSTKTATASVIVADRLGRTDLADHARGVLDRLQLRGFRALTASQPGDLPPGHDWAAQVLHAGYMAQWLLAYWLGRDRGLWSA